MATTIGTNIIYKTGSGYVPGVIINSYTVSGSTYTAKVDVASNNAAVDAADVLLFGESNTRLDRVNKTAAGTEGNVTPSQIASMAVGTWGVVV